MDKFHALMPMEVYTLMSLTSSLAQKLSKSRSLPQPSSWMESAVKQLPVMKTTLTYPLQRQVGTQVSIVLGDVCFLATCRPPPAEMRGRLEHFTASVSDRYFSTASTQTLWDIQVHRLSTLMLASRSVKQGKQLTNRIFR